MTITTKIEQVPSTELQLQCNPIVGLCSEVTLLTVRNLKIWKYNRSKFHVTKERTVWALSELMASSTPVLFLTTSVSFHTLFRPNEMR